MNGPLRLRRAPRSVTLLLAVALVAATAGVAGAASIQAIQIITPKSESQITNLDILRLEIKNYYGDPTGTGTFGADSNYAHEAEGVASEGSHWLAPKATAQAPSGTKAIVLDVDDTTLATWNYEISVNWAFTPASNAVYVNGQLFPAVPGIVAMVNQAAAEGYAIFFLTGRPASQEAATLGNLTSDGIGVDAGYPVPTTLNDGEDGLFTKPAVVNYPDYLLAACATEISLGKSCTTIHYKSATRAHIESLGYDIVANFGDQYSDLLGGFADMTFKLPNPNYYLPSSAGNPQLRGILRTRPPSADAGGFVISVRCMRLSTAAGVPECDRMVETVVQPSRRAGGPGVQLRHGSAHAPARQRLGGDEAGQRPPLT